MHVMSWRPDRGFVERVQVNVAHTRLLVVNPDQRVLGYLLDFFVHDSPSRTMCADPGDLAAVAQMLSLAS
jgi:hypothetical protein